MKALSTELRRNGSIKLDLSNGQTVSLQPYTPLRVEAGRAWITVEGELDDWFVGPGESFTAPGDRAAYLQADPFCTISVPGRWLTPFGSLRSRIARAIQWLPTPGRGAASGPSPAKS